MSENSSNSKKVSNPKEKQGAACEKCEGPFDLWGISTDFRLLRCRECGTVCFVDWSDPLQVHKEFPQETYAIPVDVHFPE